jgi:hypothetical protein
MKFIPESQLKEQEMSGYGGTSTNVIILYHFKLFKKNKNKIFT